MDWIPEKVLQKYVRDNPEHFKEIFDGKIPRIESNHIPDKYPDLTFIIDNKITIPVEVEWKTSNFLTHKHDPNILTKGIGYDSPGFLLVGKKEEKEREKIGNIKQYKIDLKKFEKWFIDNANELVFETTKELHSKDERTAPKLWMCYLAVKGNAIRNFQIGLKHEVWGISEKFLHNTQIKGIKKGDLIAFVGPGRNFTGRISKSNWTKKSFKGYFEKISVHKITSDYSDTDRKKIWNIKNRTNTEEELYTHRFNFDRVPILVMKNCRINKLGLTAKDELHTLVYANIRSCDPSSLIDIMHSSEKLNLEESKKELEHISKIMDS